MMDATTPALTAPHELEYTYTRSVGPVIGRFLGELQQRRIVGVRTAAGRVLVPPQEYDPETGESTGDDFVEVGPGGVVETWAWVAEPRAKHPLQRPFAFALIRLDGAHTAMLHCVDAGESHMASGMRVRPRWRDETLGEIHDILCFEPEDA
jgi:uncharacterized OB-fold protein